MKYIKMFISGIALPSVILPFLVLIVIFYGHTQILSLPFIHFIPLVWGIWNILYFAIFKNILPGNLTSQFLSWGAILGFLIACYGVFLVKIPTIFGLQGSLYYLPLIVGPILYAILWGYIVKPLNDLLDVRNKK